MMTLAANPQQVFPSEAFDYTPGMSDSEELRRIGNYFSETDGLGDPIFDDGLDQDVLRDIGVET